MADDNLPAKFHLHPFCRNSRFCSIWDKKTQGWVALGENLGKKGSKKVSYIQNTLSISK